MYVQRGWLRLSHRSLDAKRSSALNPVHVDTLAAQLEVPPGQPVLARVAVQPFTHVFRKGSRLRLWLDTPSVTGLWSFLVNPRPSVITVLSDPQHRSRLVVGRMPGERAHTPLPACDAVASQLCRPDPLG
jgi:predicted acyl esterase